MAYKRRSGEENSEAINVIISKSGGRLLRNRGNHGRCSWEGQEFAYRTIELPVQRDLDFAKQKSNGGDIAVIRARGPSVLDCVQASAAMLALPCCRTMQHRFGRFAPR
jgi:hypothetical protein